MSKQIVKYYKEQATLPIGALIKIADDLLLHDAPAAKELADIIQLLVNWQEKP